MLEVAIVEGRVECAIAHLVEGLARYLMLNLDLEQRMFFEGMREKLADAHEFRIRHGADAGASDDLALDRAGAAAQRLRRGHDLLRFG